VWWCGMPLSSIFQQAFALSMTVHCLLNEQDKAAQCSANPFLFLFFTLPFFPPKRKEKTHRVRVVCTLPLLHWRYTAKVTVLINSHTRTQTHTHTRTYIHTHSDIDLVIKVTQLSWTQAAVTRARQRRLTGLYLPLPRHRHCSRVALKPAPFTAFPLHCAAQQQ
jgi:hypothetical protein